MNPVDRFAVPNVPVRTITSPSTAIGSTSQGSASSASASHLPGSQMHRAISPPTPAPSPQPDSRQLVGALLPSSVSPVDAGRLGLVTPTHENDDVSPLVRQFTHEFPLLDSKERYAFLAQIVDLCNARELAHVSSLISPRLKVDFLSALPIEVSLQILSYLDDPRILARASCVSRFWRSLVNDEQTWKVMCKRYRFRQVPLMASSSMSHALGLDTPDQTMEPMSTDSELTASEQLHGTAGSNNGAEETASLESSQVLGSLYEAYRARGLDPSTALAELKALHELFLTKRAREMGVEERRRQLHALQNDNVFMDMMQDKTFVRRIAETSMSEDDKRFYGQLEEFVSEKQLERAESSRTGGATASSSSSVKAEPAEHVLPDAHDTAAVGWLSTGPPAVRTLGGERTPTGDDPRTPSMLPATRYFGSSAALPFREVGRTLVSPTSRLGSMTSGLLTSLWDRTAGVSGAPSGSTLDVRDHFPSHPPSAGDHGHSTEGHPDMEDHWAETTESQEEQQPHLSSDDMQIDEEIHSAQSHTDGRSTDEGSPANASGSGSATASQPRRIGTRKASRRFAPFARPGDETALSASEGSAGLGLGRPSTRQEQGGRSSIMRSSTTGDGVWSIGPDDDSAVKSEVRSEDPFEFSSAPVPKRATSMGQPSVSARRTKPFSYKTHFKLAYQTESNWLRGGRLLTQHVSSDGASGDGATVTSLSIDDEWIVVGMANSKIHTFDARTGLYVRTLVGHTAGVWCLALISATRSSSATDSRSSHAKAKGKGKSEEEEASSHMSRSSDFDRYPHGTDGPPYRSTADLNLIHHDPRPAARVFSPELGYADLGSDDMNEFVQPTVPLPIPVPLPQQSGHRWGDLHRPSSSSSLFGRAQTPQPEPVTVPMDVPRPALSLRSTEQSGRLGVDLAAIARVAHSASKGGAGAGGGSSSTSHTSRGAGLGSNFGSPCGSVAGYGNERALVVSSGCDRDVRVWDLETGECKYVLTGHRSTVRCLRVFEGRPIAISGSRDGTMRVWNVETGMLQHLLPGHQHSVRCLDLSGNNMVASASYDCTARIWNVDTGKCLHVLRGHYHQLYAIAFDGIYVATGSLDTTVRVWSAETGECLAVLHGHTSLVGQLQLTDSTLVTGGSDGKVMVYSLKTMKQLYQLSAHDNSVTCLQFDDRFIVTGGNDGKVKLWNFRTGEYVRELCESSEQVWKVSFRDDKCVVLGRRHDKTAMDVISFRPIEEIA